MVEAMRGYAMGDPADEATKLGPMQSVEARDEIHEQVEKSIANGAKLLLGGESARPARRLVSGDGADRRRRRPARA